MALYIFFVLTKEWLIITIKNSILSEGKLNEYCVWN